MQEQVMNLATVQEGNRLVNNEYFIVRNREERLSGIAFLTKRLQYMMCMEDHQFAELLMIDESQVRNVRYLEDREISTDLLFRIHCIAIMVSERNFLDRRERKKIIKLKEACQEEISRRSNWL